MAIQIGSQAFNGYRSRISSSHFILTAGTSHSDTHQMPGWWKDTFWQSRVGLDGREFQFPKFRSMIPTAELAKDSIAQLNHHKSGVTFKVRRDPRVTWIGRILRKTSLDELPQLWCVLRGEMTLVGPRPAIPKEVEAYDQIARRRLNAVPGLTCYWQVSGRGDLDFEKQLELDLQYIERQSLWLDLKLLIRTIPAVLSGKGAY